MNFITIFLGLLGLNVLLGVTAGIWLLVERQIAPVVHGVAGGIIGSMILLIVIGLLSEVINKLGLPLVRKGQTGAAAALAFLFMLPGAVIVYGWCMFVFWYFVSKAPIDLFWLLTLWSFPAAFAGAMGVHLSDGGFGGAAERSYMGILFSAQAAFLAMMAAILFRLPLDPTVLFGIVLIVGILITTPSVVSELYKWKDVKESSSTS